MDKQAETDETESRKRFKERGAIQVPGEEQQASVIVAWGLVGQTVHYSDLSNRLPT